METTAPFGTPQLFLTDSSMVFTVLNHLRYQALNRVFGTSREQANVLTFVLLLGAADSAFETARRVGGTRLRMSDAGLGARSRGRTRRPIAPRTASDMRKRVPADPPRSTPLSAAPTRK